MVKGKLTNKNALIPSKSKITLCRIGRKIKIEHRLSLKTRLSVYESNLRAISQIK